MNIGNKIRVARENIGYSQEELAKFLGITARTLQNYEYNRSDVGISLLIKMAEILKVESEYFLKGDSLVDKRDSLVDSLVDKKGLVSQNSPQNLSISQRKSVTKSVTKSASEMLLSQTSPQDDSETNCRSLAGVLPESKKNIAGVHSSPQNLSPNHQKIVPQSVSQSSKNCPPIQNSPQDDGSLVSKSEFVSQKDEFVSPPSPLPKASISPLGDIYVSSDHKLYPYIQGEYDVNDLMILPVFVNGRVSCGSGEPYNDGDVYFLPQSKSFLKTKFNLSSTGALGIIQAVGNSMHPTINEGDLLLFQCDGSAIDGGIYIIEFDGDYFTKRLIKRPSIKLISDNPIYEPIEIANLQEIKIIGRVVGVISNLRL